MAKLARLLANEGAHEQSGADVRRIPRLRTRYYAFLSYSHKDKDIADWLHRELEKFRVPHSLAGKLTATGVVPRRLVPIFRDQHDLSAADDLGEEIKAALAASQFLVVLCSPASANSRWTNAEIESFKRTRPEGCVLAAVASGEPFASDMPGREADECFPPALRFKYDRRGHRTAKRAEPLAADLRGGPEERRTGFLKLVAGMLGVGLDELVQRDTTRRHRQMAWLAAASLVGMAVTSTLAVTAIHARDAAREQRRQAEGLIQFMVGDLREKLEPIGKLSVLDGVGSRVLAYYSKQDTSELSDAALVQRSKALNLMADVAYDRGNLDEAQQLYRQAVSGTAEAVRRNPNDAGRLYEHAQNVFWVGEIAREAGRPQESEAAYREYKRIADQMASIEPDNLKYRMEVLYANEDVGISLFNQHRFAEASAAFNGVLSQIQTLASLYPANKTYRKEVATTLAWVADAQRAQGNLQGAIASRTRQVHWLTELLGSGADSDVQERLAVAHQGLGVALTDAGELTRAIPELNAAANQADQLAQIEPRNAAWKSTAARTHLDLAIALTWLGRRVEADQQTALGCSLAAALPPSFAVAAVQRLRTTCAMIRARLALAAGANAQAASFAQQAIASARTEHSEDPIAVRYRVALAYRLLGDARQSAGDRTSAIAAWNSAFSALPAGVAERPWELNERFQLVRRLGKSSEAQALAAKLSQTGYKIID
jgi:eukaryotic-like serine/threonine-protein kinase